MLTGPELFDLIERFQTMIVGSIGFLGVVWTLHTNAKNAKAEHQRSLDIRRTTLRRILAAEFRNYSQALRSNIKKGPPDDTMFSIGRIRRTLFESLSSDLGLLEPNEIDVIVNAIISLEGKHHFLENKASEHTTTRFLLPVSVWDEYSSIASTTADALDLGIQALELSSDLQNTM